MCPKLGVNSSVDIRVIHDNGNDIFIDAEGKQWMSVIPTLYFSIIFYSDLNDISGWKNTRPQVML